MPTPRLYQALLRSNEGKLLGYTFEAEEKLRAEQTVKAVAKQRHLILVAVASRIASEFFPGHDWVFDSHRNIQFTPALANALIGQRVTYLRGNDIRAGGKKSCTPQTGVIQATRGRHIAIDTPEHFCLVLGHLRVLALNTPPEILS